MTPPFSPEPRAQPGLWRESLGPLLALLQAKGRMAWHWVASVRRESRLKVSFVSFCAGLLWLGLFATASLFFRFFNRFGAEILGGPSEVGFSDLVMGRLFSVFSLTLFVMLIVSNVLVAFATLYSSDDVAYLLQSPISIPVFFLGRLYECVTFSSWALAFLASPVLLAYGLERQAPFLYYLALVAFYLPFVVIPAALGSILTLLLVRLVSRLRRQHLIAASVVPVVVLFVVFRRRLAAPDLTGLSTVQAIFDAMGQAQSALLPSFWLTRGVLGAASGELSTAGFYLLLLYANALFFVWLATLAAQRWFYAGWASLDSSGPRRSGSRRRRISRALDRLLRPLPQATRVLVTKDIRLFWRDPAQWSQFVLFFGVMALYLANLRATHGVFGREGWRDWIALLNSAACMLILATLTTRFVYPLVSLEGRRFWILGLAPVTLRQVVWQKFGLSVAATSVFTVGLVVLSGWRLELERAPFALSLVSIVATTVALSGLAVGLGSLYPNFQEDNPARITSGMGGTLNFILSLVYILLVTVAQALVLHWGALDSLLAPRLFPWVLTAVLSGIVVLTLITWLVPMSLGLRNLRNVEF